MSGTCEQCGAPLLDGKCLVDGDFDYDVDAEAYEDLVQTYLRLFLDRGAAKFEEQMAHDLEDDLLARVRRDVLSKAGIVLRS